MVLLEELCDAGSYIPVHVSPVGGTGVTGGGAPRQQLNLQLPLGLQQGSVQVEVAHGGFISHSQVSLQARRNIAPPTAKVDISCWPDTELCILLVQCISLAAKRC